MRFSRYHCAQRKRLTASCYRSHVSARVPLILLLRSGCRFRVGLIGIHTVAILRHAAKCPHRLDQMSPAAIPSTAHVLGSARDSPSLNRDRSSAPQTIQ